MSQAERYRLIYHMITSPQEEGGAGITPKSGQWKNVESIFPLHDLAFNKTWVRDWRMKTFLKVEDLDEIRNRLGEKVRGFDCQTFAFTRANGCRLPFISPSHNRTSLS